MSRSARSRFDDARAYTKFMSEHTAKSARAEYAEERCPCVVGWHRAGTKKTVSGGTSTRRLASNREMSIERAPFARSSAPVVTAGRRPRLHSHRPARSSMRARGQRSTRHPLGTSCRVCTYSMSPAWLHPPQNRGDRGARAVRIWANVMSSSRRGTPSAGRIVVASSRPGVMGAGAVRRHAEAWPRKHSVRRSL